MKVFLTGASGYIGSVVAQKLRSLGHEVLGLTRLGKESQLQQQEIEPYIGDLKNADSLKHGAKIADAAIHTAFLGGAASLDDFAEGLEVDRHAVESMLAALEGTGKPFIYTSGTGVLPDTEEQVFNEETAFEPPSMVAPRAATEQLVLAATARNIRSIVIRPPLIYGQGGNYQIPTLIKAAKALQISYYIGTGEYCWSTVHIEDLADLYVLALERSPSGELFHAAAGETTMKEIASSVSRAVGLQGETQSCTPEEAQKIWGAAVAHVIGSNSRVSGAKAVKLLGWNPRSPSIQAEIEQGSYRPDLGEN